MFVLEFIGAAVFLASLVILLCMDRRRRIFLQAVLMLAGLLSFGLQAWARFSEGKAGLREIGVFGALYVLFLVALIAQTVRQNRKHRKK